MKWLRLVTCFLCFQAQLLAINLGTVDIEPQSGVTIFSAYFANTSIQGKFGANHPLQWTKHMFPKLNEVKATCSFAMYGVSNAICIGKNATERVEMKLENQYGQQSGQATLYANENGDNITIKCGFSTIHFDFRARVLDTCLKPIYYYCPLVLPSTCSRLADMPDTQVMQLTTPIFPLPVSDSMKNTNHTRSSTMAYNTFVMHNAPFPPPPNPPTPQPPKPTVCFPLAYAKSKFGTVEASGESSPFNEVLAESVQHYLNMGFVVYIYDNWAAHQTVLSGHPHLSKQLRRNDHKSIYYFNRTLASLILEADYSEEVERMKHIPYYDMDKVMSVIHCVMEAQIRSNGPANVLVADPDEVLYCPHRKPTYPDQVLGMSGILQKYGHAYNELSLSRCEPVPRNVTSFHNCMNTAGRLKNNQSIFSCFGAFEYATCAGGKTLYTAAKCPFMFLHSSCRPSACPCPRAEVRREECVLVHLHIAQTPSHQYRTPPIQRTTLPPPLELLSIVESLPSH